MPAAKTTRSATVSRLRVDPAKVKLGEASAARLAQLTELNAKELAGKTIGELTKLYPFEIDPALFLMRKVCGKVVKTDPVTGVDYPVPFATVQVQDTDCSFIGYFPPLSPWSWFFPFNCRREVIATAKTDACGNFCVWIPRFDIDWVLHWRRLRRCYPIIFERPNLRDIIEHLIPERIPPIPPIPGPDPAPFDRIDRAQLVDKATQAFGRDIGVRLAGLSTPAGFGASTEDHLGAEFAPALLDHIAPPLPGEIRGELAAADAKAKLPAGLATVAHRLAIDPADLKGVDLRRYIGPFKRCYDVFIPVWTPIIDVPDITFRVLQDTDGDGDEEQIYGEGYFQVRWNAGSLGNVVLHAGANAIAAPVCGPDGGVPCGNQPAIVMAGRLPLTGAPDTFNPATGYAVRTNRPHPSGEFGDPTPITPAASPLRGVLSLFGCNKTDPNATHYRVTYEYSADGGATFSSRTPFLGFTWPLFRLNGLGVGEWHFATPDTKGWYPIALPAGPNAWLPQDLVLDWPSTSLPDGLYRTRLELGVGMANTPSSFSANVGIMVDNSGPLGPLTVEYASSPSGPWAPLGTICPVVRRGTTPHDVYFRVTLTASARHMRSAEMYAGGCGNGNFTFISGTGGFHSGGTDYEHWHDSAADNSQTMQVVYLLPASTAEGTYHFGAEVVGRAFNPNDGGHLAVPPWETNTHEVYITPSVAFSVFNANP